VSAKFGNTCNKKLRFFFYVDSTGNGPNVCAKAVFTTFEPNTQQVHG